jgi:ribosomal protein S18 acetylase RimI-like enzyme
MGEAAMIRPALPEENECLIAMADQTGAFKPVEIETLRSVLDDYHIGDCDLRDRAVAFEHEGRLAGFAYFGPTEMTDRAWHLYWIFVDRTVQARGIGAKLMAHAESAIREHGGRIIVIETSGLASYEATHRFYRKLGYSQAATVPDFYAVGDDLVFFTKRLLEVARTNEAAPHFVVDSIVQSGQLAGY